MELIFLLIYLKSIIDMLAGIVVGFVIGIIINIINVNKKKGEDWDGRGNTNSPTYNDCFVLFIFWLDYRCLSFLFEL